MPNNFQTVPGILLISSTLRLAVVLGASATLLVAGTTACGQSDQAPTNTRPAPDLFLNPPKSPAEFVEAAQLTARLDRHDDARVFLRLLIDSQPSPEELLALRSQTGIATFVELGVDGRLHPESRELLVLINKATPVAPAASNDLQQLITQLAEPGAAGEAAVEQLSTAGGAAAAALLATDTNTRSGEIADRLLRSRTDRFESGLITLLETASETDAVRILELLAASGHSDSAPRLLRWRWNPVVPTPVQAAADVAIRRLDPSLGRLESADDAAQLLADRARELVHASGRRFSIADRSAVAVELAGTRTSAEQLASARQLLTDAVAIQATDPELSALQLVAQCAAVAPSLATPATVVNGKSIDTLTAGLRAASELQNAAAMIELLKGLTAVEADASAARDISSILRRTLISPDPRVRFLSARLAASRFPVTRVESTLQSINRTALSGSIRPEAVVAGFDEAQATTLHALLQDAGYEVVVAPDGVEGFNAATKQLNCELVVLDAESYRWPLATTIANLRADARTRLTPVVVVGPFTWERRVSGLVKSDAGIRFLAGPVGAESLQTLSGPEQFPIAVRTAIQRRNELWGTTLQKLALPGPLLTTEDRAVIKASSESGR